SPIVMLSSWALVAGYEAPDLARRFGSQVQPPALHLPRAVSGEAASRPRPSEVASVYLLVLLPWLLLYEAVGALGPPPDALPAPPRGGGGPRVGTRARPPPGAFPPLVLPPPPPASPRRAPPPFPFRGLPGPALAISPSPPLPFPAPPRAFFPAGGLGRLLVW